MNWPEIKMTRFKSMVSYGYVVKVTDVMGLLCSV